MKWKSRIRNKAFLASLFGVSVAFVYQVLGIFGVVAPVSESQVVQIVGLALNALAAIGVVVDPTTPGITDDKK